MTLKDLYDMRLVNDNTQITMIMPSPTALTTLAFDRRSGKWFNDGILSWFYQEIEAFDWKSDNSLIIRIKKEADHDTTGICQAV